jgi:LPXTG-site transpeptidase (sortase) family protein
MYMALYSYKKAPIKVKDAVDNQYVTLRSEKSKQPLTVGAVISGTLSDLNHLLISSRVAGFFVPLLLILFGFSIIYKQVWPDIDQVLRQWAGYYDTESVSLVAGDYVERTKFLSNPGEGYFKKLASDANQAGDLLPDPIASSYNGTFKISIESLGLKNLPVIANVDSGGNESYLKALTKSMAHFKGTGLPISPVKNNFVVYGHSASGDYYERTHDIAASFTLLNKIKIGAIISVEMDGKTYQYRVNKSKIVQPDDVSIVVGTPGKRTLTLFTCFPNGNNAQRFVVVANPVE